MRWLANLFAALAIAMLGVASASAQDVVRSRQDKTAVSLISERAAVVPGDTFLVAANFDLDEDGWHIYWKNPGDSGLPPEVKWDGLPAGVEAGAFKWPAPHAIPLATLMNYGYEHQVVFPMEFKVPATLKPGDSLTIKGKFDFLICQEICIPDDATVSLTLPVEGASRANEESSAILARSLATVPVPLTGSATVKRTADGFQVAAIDPDLAETAKTAKSIRFFPEGHEILHAAPQKVRRGDAGVSFELKASEFAAAGDQPLPGIVVISSGDDTLRAWELPAKPGVIPDGVSSTAVSAGSSAANVGGGFESLSLLGFGGIIVAAFLGGLVLNLMPCVLPVLTIKAAGLVHTAHDPKKSRAHGLAYLGGVLVCFAAIGAVLIALKAAGEQAGLGFQLQYPPVVAFFALAMFAIGLNLLGVFEMGGSLMGMGGNLADRGGASGAFFTGLLAAFVGAPCVGPFMAPAVGVALAQPPYIVMIVFIIIGLGLAAPFVLLSFTPAFAKVLPKPGRWMETFRQVLAFPMFLTAVWLLWVLAAQAGANGVVLVVAGAAVLGFGIWLATKIGSNLPGKVVAGVVILLGFIAPSVFSATAPAAPADSSAASLAEEAWSPERVAALQAEGRPIFVDFTARWCVTCQVNKATSIDSASVREAFASTNTAFLVADWTNRDSVIAAALAEHGRAGVPLYLVYPASGGDPAVLPQVLTPGLVVKAIRDAAGASL
ncbi:MAG TPA: thioredoxin family protein [Hyphomonadaceae bacterium]|nr:thioredoxin family protein [Hyphomonadaceae bacterium]